MPQPVASVRTPTEADYDWIRQLNEFGGHQTPGSIAFILARSDHYAFVDGTHIALFTIDRVNEQVAISWLLPRDGDTTALKRVFKSGFLALEQIPEIQGWEFIGDAISGEDAQGRDVGERIAKFWQVEFSRVNPPVVMNVTKTEGHWHVSVIPFSDAVRVAKSWAV